MNIYQNFSLIELKNYIAQLSDLKTIISDELKELIIIAAREKEIEIEFFNDSDEIIHIIITKSENFNFSDEDFNHIVASKGSSTVGSAGTGSSIGTFGCSGSTIGTFFSAGTAGTAGSVDVRGTPEEIDQNLKDNANEIVEYLDQNKNNR